MSGQAGSRHELAEFTREDIADMVARGPSLRHTETDAGSDRAIVHPAIEVGGMP